MIRTHYFAAGLLAALVLWGGDELMGHTAQKMRFHWNYYVTSGDKTHGRDAGKPRSITFEHAKGAVERHCVECGLPLRAGELQLVSYDRTMALCLQGCGEAA